MLLFGLFLNECALSLGGTRKEITSVFKSQGHLKMEGSLSTTHLRRKDTTKGPPLRILSLGQYYLETERHAVLTCQQMVVV